MRLAWRLVAICLVVCALPAAAQFFNVSRVARPSETTFANTGQPWPIPGTINAENYDAGGSGVAYSAIQNPAPSCQTTSYRADSINLKASAAGPAFQLCSGGLGDQYNYTINVSGTGSGPYVLTANLADGAVSAGGLRGILIDNVQVATVATPLTGGYGNFAPAMSGQFNVSPGNHILQFRTLALDSDGGAGDFSSFTIGLSSGMVACDFGPNTTLPAGAAGADMATAGFAHCVLNADFTDASGSAVGGGWVMNNPATWLNACKGTSSLNLFWLNWVSAIGILNADPGGQAPCARAQLVNDGGTQVLNFQFAPADYSLPNDIGLALYWPACGGTCNNFTKPVGLPVPLYVETTYRLAAGIGQSTTFLFLSMDENTAFDGDPGAPGGNFLDIVTLEALANNHPSTAWAYDNYLSSGACGGKCSVALQGAPPLGAYHTYAELLTSDGAANGTANHCLYLDNAGNPNPNFPGFAFSGTFCTHTAHFNDGASGNTDELHVHNRRFYLGIGGGSAISNTMSLNIKSIRIFSCAPPYMGYGNNCTTSQSGGSLVYH